MDPILLQSRRGSYWQPFRDKTNDSSSPVVPEIIIQPKYNSCCRTCRSNVSRSLKSHDIFNEENDSMSLASILSLCTNLKVDINDELPKIICDNCYNTLINFYHFQKQAKLVDSQFRKHTYKVQDETESLYFKDVKSEVKNEQLELSEFIDSNFQSDGNREFEFPDLDVKICEKRNEEPSDFEDEKYDVISEGLEASDFEDGQSAIIDEKLEISDIEAKKSDNNEKYYFKLTKESNDSEHEFCENEQDTGINTKDEISTTNKSKEINSNEGLYTCDTCSQIYDDYNKYIEHILKHCRTEKTKNLVTCDICLKTFQNINALCAHKRKHVKERRDLTCKYCDKPFKKISHVKRHELIHENNLPYKCPLCSKVFLKKDTLEGHMNKHNGLKPYVCSYCGKSYSQSSSLNFHIKLHTDSLPNHLCHICGKNFKTNSALTAHMKRHSGIKLYECDLCSKKFVSKGELKKHIRCHTGERSFSCEQCNITFKTNASCKMHKLIHLGVKAYECSTCLMKFTRKQYLDNHYRKHTGERPYRCEICDQMFVQSGDLLRHRRIHLGGLLYRCEKCGQGFRLRSSLNQHVIEHSVTSRKEVKSMLLNISTEGKKQDKIEV